MGSDETKRLILARRARFFAITLAGVTMPASAAVMGACSDGSPNASDTRPTPCLGITCEEAHACGGPVEDGGEDADADAADAADAADDADAADADGG